MVKPFYKNEKSDHLLSPLPPNKPKNTISKYNENVIEI